MVHTLLWKGLSLVPQRAALSAPSSPGAVLLSTTLTITMAMLLTVATPTTAAAAAAAPRPQPLQSQQSSSSTTTNGIVSPYILGRAALAAPGTGSFAVTYDFSGVTIRGVLVPANTTAPYAVGVILSYYCEEGVRNGNGTSAAERNGNVVEVRVDGQFFATIDLGSAQAQASGYCTRPDGPGPAPAVTIWVTSPIVAAAGSAAAAASVSSATRRKTVAAAPGGDIVWHDELATRTTESDANAVSSLRHHGQRLRRQLEEEGHHNRRHRDESHGQNRHLHASSSAPHTLLSALPAPLVGPHTIEVVKITEPNFSAADPTAATRNNITFYSLAISSTALVAFEPLTPSASASASSFDSSSKLSSSDRRPSSPSDPRSGLRREERAASLLSTIGRARAPRIEYLGDSITCGYQVLCHSATASSATSLPERRPQLERVLSAYSGRSCTALGADCHYECWSGRGLVLNYYGPGTPMPALYNRTLATTTSINNTSGANANNDWDFSLWTPDLVTINLGTNDFASPSRDAYPHLEAHMVAEYARLFHQVLWQYLRPTSSPSPSNTITTYATAPVVVVCGPMTTLYCPLIQAGMALFEAQYAPLFRQPPYDLPNVTASHLHLLAFPDGILTHNNSCNGHPDADVSVALASIFVDFVQQNQLLP